MTKPILRKTTAHHQENDEAEKGSTSIRDSIRNGFNQAVAATRRFLLGCTSNSDHPVVIDEANRSHNPFPNSNLSQPPIQPQPQPQSRIPQYSAIQTRRNADRIAEAFGTRNPNQNELQNVVLPYPEARDIRPPPLRNRRHLSTRNLNSPWRTPHIERSNERNLQPPSQNQRTHRRILNRISFEAASTDRFVRSNRIYRLVSHNGFVAPIPVIEDDNVSSNSFRTTNSGRRRRRRFMKNGRTDWRKYEEDRNKWPSRLVKRKHEDTFESLMQEPEHKIAKFAQYWVVQKTSTDGADNAGQTQDERIMLDWEQYELERSLWPQRCVKRKRRMELESLLEEPKKKRRKVGK